MEMALSAGASRVQRAKEKSGSGYSGSIGDPDGVLWAIAWNPGFPLDRAGFDGCVSIVHCWINT